MEQAEIVEQPVVTRLNPALGAEITGIDLSLPMHPEQIRAFRGALDNYGVLCFRDQKLTEQQQIAFTEQWGLLEDFPEENKTVSASTVYNVANVSAQGEHLPETDHRVIFQKVNALWHTDSSYRYVPAYASLLYGIEVMPDDAVGGRTGFSNMVLAYEALPDDLKSRIEPLHMVHSYEHGRRMFASLPPLSNFEKNAVPPVSHPLVRVHPDGRRSLFMTANAGNEISGMPLEEGQALHRQLVEHVSRPEFCYFHKWKKGDLVVWDNRTTLHKAEVYDMGRYRRVFRRTTLAGEGPVLGPYSQEVVARAKCPSVK
ncbi:TauD/TfdA family dioxygenase [Variovorax dokdonensis]|uniref:TauD/TfdA family dioxygenase n=1 Tax=Variovorax dokdonensis TaxID=344883 RepID=A0ABT7NFU8_9BURK|nr:TauD/TfdA family dioxygenase [Variovorax dokdonensis]MDM0046811.1 TauD/TfdA family dioxygenase [Variovorax dokdonensis]